MQNLICMTSVIGLVIRYLFHNQGRVIKIYKEYTLKNINQSYFSE